MPRIITPAPDSQYRLRACKCGSDAAQYVQYTGQGGRLLWRVDCPACDKSVDIQTPVRHDAQLAWNEEVKQCRD